MKKLPSKFKLPLIGGLMVPTMVLGMPLIILLQTLPDGAPIVTAWGEAVKTTGLSALVFALCAGAIVNFIVSKVIVESE